MKYVYLFLPAIGWGLMPLVIASVKNSTVYNQIVGTVAASFIFGAVVMAIMHPAMSWSLFLLSALGGACWVIGQVGQYISYEKIGVSETMPISTGLQLIGVPLVGVLAFGEWASPQAKLYGGMLVAVFIYTLVTKNLHVWKEKSTVQSGGAGILYAIAALAYILSVQDNGVNMAFVISQLCVVISTLGGLVFLHEKKTRNGLIFTIAGLVLIIGGAMLTTLF